MIASIATAVVLAAGGCTANYKKVEKIPENKKGDLVAENKTEKPKTKTLEVFMSEIEVPEYEVGEETINGIRMETFSFKKSVEEGDNLPMWAGLSFKDIAQIKVTDINEKGIEVDLGYFEIMTESAAKKVMILYGRYLKLGEAAFAWEIKPEKSYEFGKAEVTVKITRPSESDRE